jgi:Zinc binding domain
VIEEARDSVAVVSGAGEECAEPKLESAICPASGTVGLRVDLITLKALLGGSALRRLEGTAYRFCPAPDCRIVYFDRDAKSVFEKRDLKVRVSQKESEESIPVCYCFDITKADIRREIAAVGRTEAPAMIAAEIRAGHCACDLRNPQGTCCLGNLARIVELVESRT